MVRELVHWLPIRCSALTGETGGTCAARFSWWLFHLGAKKFALRHCVIAKARKSSPCALKTPQIWRFCACWASFFAEEPLEGLCWASFVAEKPLEGPCWESFFAEWDRLGQLFARRVHQPRAIFQLGSLSEPPLALRGLGSG